MGLFKRRQPDAMQLTERQVLENKYTSSRSNILIVVALTVINIILLVTNSNTYFLFSAYIPFFLADFGMYFCGMYPAEYYSDLTYVPQFLPMEVFAVTIILAIVILALYFLSWILSKKFKVGWLVTALVFFCIDTLAMLLIQGFLIESVVDYIFHAWVIFSLSGGIVAYSKLKKLPPETEVKLDVTMVNGEPVAEEEQPIE